MHITMLTQFYPPIIGGIERHVRNLSRALIERGHDVSIVTMWQPNTETYEEDLGIKIYRVRSSMHRVANLIYFNAEQVYAPPFPDPELIWNLRKTIKSIQPDVIHAHNWLVHNYLPVKGRQPLIVTLHDYDLGCPKWTYMYKDNTICTGSGVAKCIDCCKGYYGTVKGTITVLGSGVMNHWERQAADFFIPVSQAVADGNHLKLGKYEVIPNFIPDNLPMTVPDELKDTVALLPDEPFILFVGAFGTHKGFDILIDAYNQLETTLPLVLIGYDIPVLDLATLDIPESVLILRNWQNEAVLEAYRRCYMAITPSNCGDSCPTVVLEAMEMGKAVIGTEVGGIPDMIDHEQNGLLVPPGNAEALASAMQSLINQPDKVADMGTKSKIKVEGFRASSVLDRIEAVYERFTQKKPV